MSVTFLTDKDAAEFEKIENRVTVIDENADDEHYPTAKAVYEYAHTDDSFSNEKYFDIDDDGVISLKREYRGTGKDGCEYTISDNGLGNEGSRYTELPDVLIIPDVVNEIAVTALAPSMFRSHKRIKSITIPKHITEIPDSCFRNALALEELKGTENIKKLGASAFQNSRIKKVMFPALTEFDGDNHFAATYYLTMVDIGNVVTALPANCFATCERLSSIFGGGSLTTIGASALRGTRRLKKLPNIDSITNIGENGLYWSRVNHNWKDRKDVLFGANATYAQYNSTDIWSGFDPTPCQDVKLRSTFHQADPRWNTDEYAVDEWYKLARKCTVCAQAHVYSILEQKDIVSPIEYIDAVKATEDSNLRDDNGNVISPSDTMHNQATIWLRLLGYTVTQYSFTSKDNVGELYEALSNGKLVLITTYGPNKTAEPPHCVLLYGINAAGEVMVCDSAPYCYIRGDYVAGTYAMPLHHIARYGAGNGFIIVEKT